MKYIDEIDIKKVVKRIEAFGIKSATADVWMLGFLVDKVTRHILTQSNQKKIPEALEMIAIDMVVGEYLLSKKQSGMLVAENIDFEPIANEISEGDTSVKFGVGTATLSPEQRLDMLIKRLLSSGEGDIACYRRLVW